MAIVCRSTRLLTLQERGEVGILTCDQAGSAGGSDETGNEELGSDHSERLDNYMSECLSIRVGMLKA